MIKVMVLLRDRLVLVLDLADGQFTYVDGARNEVKAGRRLTLICCEALAG